MSAVGIPRHRTEAVDPRAVNERLTQVLDREIEDRRTFNILDRLDRLGTKPSSEESSTGALTRNMGDMISGLSKGYQGILDLTQKQMEQMQGGKQGADPMVQLVLGMMTLMVQQMGQQGGGGETTFWREQFVDLVRGRIEELEGQRGMSPTDQQFHHLTQQVAAQAMQGMLDPFSQLKRLKDAQEQLGMLGIGGGGNEYSEGALRRLSMENQALGEHHRHLETVRAAEDRRMMTQEGIPAYIAQGAAALQQTLAGFGLVPVYQNGGPSQVGQRRAFTSRARGEETADGQA